MENRLKNLAADLVRSLGFLTRLPFPQSWFDRVRPASVGESAGAFPLAGALLSVPGAILLAAGDTIGLPPFAAAVLAVGLTIMITGALHEDGLADTADGFFGGGDRDKRLAIMKDSATGSFGTIAIVLAVLMRMVFLGSIAATGAIEAAAAFIAAQAASRSAMVWFWSSMPNARDGGVASISGLVAPAALHTALGSGLVIFIPLAFVSSGFGGLVASALLAGAALSGFRRMCLNKIGGQTGDTLGASQVLVELGLLLGLVIAA